MLAITLEAQDLIVNSPLGVLLFTGIENAVVDNAALIGGKDLNKVSVDTVGGVAVEYGSTSLLGGIYGRNIATLIGKGSLGQESNIPLRGSVTP